MSVCPHCGGIRTTSRFNPQQGYYREDLDFMDDKFKAIKRKMENTIMQHPGAGFSKYEIVRIELNWNTQLFRKFAKMRRKVAAENGGSPVERLLFHGTPCENICDITQNGFDVSRASSGGMFGAGIYFAMHSSKANQYVFGPRGCDNHNNSFCYSCERRMLLCRVVLGKSSLKYSASSAPPSGYHSVVGLPSDGGLKYKEYTVYRGEQKLTCLHFGCIKAAARLLCTLN